MSFPSSAYSSSLPFPATRKSSSNPPKITSSPVPPYSSSPPSPPCRLSSPLSPYSLSFSKRPCNTSLPDLPYIISSVLHPRIISGPLVPLVLRILPIEQAASITLSLHDSVSGISNTKRSNNIIQTDAIILVGNPFCMYIYTLLVHHYLLTSMNQNFEKYYN